jgi:hypothetical protein
LKEVVLYFHKDLEAVNKDEHQLIPYTDSVSIVCFSLRAAGGSGLYFVVALRGCKCWVNWGILLDDAGSGHVWVDPLVICHLVVFFALEVWDAEV